MTIRLNPEEYKVLNEVLEENKSVKDKVKVENRVYFIKILEKWYLI